MCARNRSRGNYFQVSHPLLDTPTKYTVIKFCSAADVCVPKTMDISSLLMDISKLGVHYCILYLPLNPLPYLAWAPHESVFS